MMKRLKYFGFFATALVCVLGVGLYCAFPDTSQLLLSLLTQNLPDKSHIQRIRADLLEQERFIDMLVKHEKQALHRLKHQGINFYEKKYIHKTPTAMFGIDALHDDWEVWVRTDIVKGKPLTSFLIRLGLIKDTNAEIFFSRQCRSKMMASALRAGISLYNDMFDRGIFKPIRLNITELDQTSSISRTRTKRSQWRKTAKDMHRQGIGVSFISIRPR